MNKQKLPWHRPRIVVVEAWAPCRLGAMFTLLDGRTLFFRTIPDVVNTTDQKRKPRDREQNKKDKQASRQRQKDGLHAITLFLNNQDREEVLRDFDFENPPGRVLTAGELREYEGRAARAALRAGLKKRK